MMENFQEFLVWLTTSSGATALASWILERIKWFQGLDSSKKWWVSLISSAALALLAKVAIDYIPQSTVDIIAPYFAVVAGVIISYLSNQAAHRADKVLRGE